MTRPIKVACASIAGTLSQTDRNLVNMLEMIDEAAASGASWYAFRK